MQDQQPDPSADRQFVSALARGLSVLRAFSHAPGSMGNGEICARTGLRPSTVSRLTHTLTRLGYLQPDAEKRRYSLTPKVLALGYPVLAGTSLVDEARPILRQLSQATGETAAIAVQDGLHAGFLEVVVGHNMLAVRLAPGGRLPLAVSAVGLALMKGLPEAQRRSLLARVKASLAARGAAVEPFNARMARALVEDAVVLRDAWTSGVGGVAVPVALGAQRAAIVIPVATDRVDEHQMRGPIAQALLEATRRLRA